jgi:uncharacterized protein YndB with AHSA1/START domain
MSTTSTDTRYDQAAIEADPAIPAIHIWRDFAGTPDQLFRAHTDPDLYARWIGPDDRTAVIDRWDATDGGAFRFLDSRDDDQQAFRGCFHTVRRDRIVQTFTWEGMPDGVALERLELEDLGGGRTRLTSTSLVDSFEARDAMMASGMDTGIREGYEKLDELLAG